MVRRFIVLTSFALLGILSASPAFAQTTVLNIDPGDSTARLFVASSDRPDARINVGVARLSGDITESANNSLPTAFAFQIFAADRSAQLLQSKSQEPAPHPLYGASNTLLTFKSKAVEPVDANTFRVRGDLTATYITRYATYDPYKAYSGPSYGPVVTHTTTRDVTFLFRTPPHSKARRAKKGTAEWSATTSVPSSAFPGLWNAVVTTDWPTFVAAEKCVMPSSTTGYPSGESCAGKVVEPEPRTDIRCVMPSVGEDFSGVVCTGKPLSLVPISEEETVASGQPDRSSASQETPENEGVVVELEIHLAQTNPTPRQSASPIGDPTADTRGPEEIATPRGFR